MTRYTNVKVNISEGQKEKLLHAIKAGCPAVSIRLGHEDLQGNDILAITTSQAKKLAKTHENGKGVTIRMSSSQLKHNKKIEGGFLGLSQINRESFTNVSENRFTGVRHWRSFRISFNGSIKSFGIESLPQKRRLCLSDRNGWSWIVLKPFKGKGLESYGNGLYLKQGGQLYDGKGLLLGPHSPFANIPILGAIL